MIGIAKLLLEKESINLLVGVGVRPNSKSILTLKVIVGTLNTLMMFIIIPSWIVSIKECYQPIER